jgi:hypothetical protein
MSIIEWMGLNPRPLGTVVTILIFVSITFAFGSALEGLVRGFNHRSVRQGNTAAAVLLWLAVGLMALIIPL